ncbi:Decarboxylase NovR [compost metagenome]
MSEQQRLVHDMGDKPVLMLRNHGLLTVGETVSQAFLRMYYLEKACEIQLAAQACGELVLPPHEVCAHTERQFNDPGRPLEDGELSDPDAMQLAWAALLRLLDRVAPDYRD